MNKKEFPSNFNIVKWVILIGSIIGMLVIGIYVQIDIYKGATNFCDKKYGVDNWTLNDTTGTGLCKHYIGQCWVCVLDSNHETLHSKVLLEKD